jgi:TolA-binding protein
LQKSKEINMVILKKLGLMLLTGVSLIYADLDDDIRKNELVINSLQEKLDALQAKGDDQTTKDLQDHIDKMVKEQNDLLAKKAGVFVSKDGEMVEEQPAAAVADNNSLDSKIRKIVQEELANQQKNKLSTNNVNHSPTYAELKATKDAEAKAPQLPEQNSEAMAQYELALEQYNKAAYKQAAGGFGRIIKTYRNDPIAAKALVHLAFCLEKQGDLDSASVVCEEALKKKLDGTHQVDCQLIRLRQAKAKGSEADVVEITKALKALKLTAEQQKTFDAVLAKKSDAPKAEVKKAA